MRIRRLELIRYGRFTDEQLELSRGTPDLHIVVGPNEAGKSTILAALEDLLFGIHSRSPMNFLHAYPSMRLGATLEANGKSLDFRRRKGNKNTILMPDGTPIRSGQRALMPYVGKADRSFFERMFSLDHERLRRGGKEILDDRNEVGQVLFSASSGIQDLRERLQELDKEADRLWAKRRSAKRRFYQADDRRKAAERQLREHRVTVANWQKLKREFESCREDHTRLEKRLRAKDAELRKLDRIRRVAWYIREKSRIEAAITELGDVADIPADAAKTLRQAGEDLRLATRRLNEQRSELERGRKERASLTWNDALLLRKEEIGRLHEMRIQVHAEKMDLPKRLRDLHSVEDKIRDLAVELGWDAGDIGELLNRIPNRTKANHVRLLLNRRSQLIGDVESAKAALVDAERRLAEVRQQAEAIGTPRDVTRLAAIVSATDSHLGSEVRSANNEVAEACADSQRMFDELRPRPSSIREADSIEVPTRSQVEAHRDKRRETDQQLRDCKLRRSAAIRDLDQRRKERDRFVAEERPVSAVDVHHLREQRDAGWSIIRRRYVDQERVSDEEIEGFAEGHDNLASAYETSVKAADSAADRRVDTAEAAARLSELNRSIALSKDRLDALCEELSELTKRSHSLDEKWGTIWASLPFDPLGPDDMLRWLDLHAGLRAAERRRVAAQQRADALRSQEANEMKRLRSELDALGIEAIPPPKHGLRVLVTCAEAEQRRQQHLKEAAQQLAIEVRKAESDVRTKRAQLERAEAARSQWGTQWSAAIGELDLDPGEDPDVVNEQIGAIDQLRVAAARANDLRVNRVQKIERDIEDFRLEASSTLQAVAPDLVGEEPFDAVPKIESRLATDLRTQTVARTMDKEITARVARTRELELELRESHSAISELQARANVDDMDALRKEIEKFERSKEYRDEHSKTVEFLAQQGDGHSIEDLEAECAAVDLDEAASRARAVSEGIDDLRKRQMKARDLFRAARARFEDVGGSDAAAIAAAARQEALAEIQEVAEQYVRARTAALLLRWAIDRNRREKQGPMLKKASGLFSDLTLGSFEGLELDFDGDRPLLVGRRSSGERIRVRGLSDGSVDQLYLALRIAALEDYLEEASPLPFVADDLFINFDDERAAAGFRALGRLAKVCQVLFFTHHEHLINIAQKALPVPAPVLRMPR